MKDKLKGFPPIYALMLQGAEGAKRKENFVKKANELELDYRLVEVKRYPECGTVLEGNMFDHLSHFHPNRNKTTLAVSANHIRMMREWINSSNEDEEWAVFCEGDISFDTVEYWPFTWEDFKSIIPEDTRILQMCVMKERLDFDLKLVQRDHTFWGANAYLVSRKYAERKVRRYCYSGNENLFNISTTPTELGTYNPCLPEDVIFCDDRFDEKEKWVDISGMYAIPLFVEDLSQESYFEDTRKDAASEKVSHAYTMNLWKEYAKEAMSWTTTN